MKPTNRMWLAAGLGCEFAFRTQLFQKTTQYMEDHAISQSAMYVWVSQYADAMADEIDKQHTENSNLELDYYMILDEAALLLHDWITLYGNESNMTGKADWTKAVKMAVRAGKY